MTIWNPDISQYDLPKYKALATAIDDAIVSGELKAGDKLPTHRRLADTLSVTVGTVTRAYAEAERKQLIESRVGSGTFVKTHSSGNDFELNHPSKDVIDLSFSFALVLNQTEELAEELKALSSDAKLLREILEYQTPGGILRHREAGMKWLEMTGVYSGNTDRIIITNGGQHGFHTATAALCQSGDTVISCGLTYPGFSVVTQQLGLRHIGIEWDSEGILPKALRLACSRFKPRVFYVNTRINNPTCEVMTEQRIDEIAEILREHQIWVIEDDVQGCLQNKSIPTFANRHPDITVYITSTSKALTGGLRIGYILPPPSIDRTIRHALKASCWMAAPMMAEITSRWIEKGLALSIIQTQQKAMKKRQQMVSRYLNQYHYNSAEHSYNVWLKLPENRNAQEFCQSLAAQNVLVKPSTAFAAGNFVPPQAVRFCLGGDTNRSDLEKALEIIKTELQQPGPEIDFCF